MFRFLFALGALALALVVNGCNSTAVQPKAAGLQGDDFKVIAYYAGDGSDLQRYNFGQLSHVIYSFLHLQGNQLAFDGPGDQQALAQLVALKQQHPRLKVMLSLGGWGGCATCSQVFSSEANRQAFAQSVLTLLQTSHTDGIDLDWEYPAIAGFPGHSYNRQDKNHFSALVKTLRQTLGSSYQISFAAGGFADYLHHSVDWASVMPLVDMVNLMSYDLVNGFSKTTGHHSALYSTAQQPESTDQGVKGLLSLGVEAHKIVIGAAFYARTWEQVKPDNQGLYQAGVHVPGPGFKDFPQQLAAAAGWQYGWDDQAKAPYAYNPQRQAFASFDDRRSVAEKVNYAKRLGLGGIMFWQLGEDRDSAGLLDAIDQAVRAQK